MKGCNNIKQLIDQADKPDLLSFEVNQHIRACRDCERFADQRAGLRKLLASGARVTAPVSFDALLNARLAEVRDRGSFSWLSPAGYLRLGAATAGLVVMALAAQYAGLFSNNSKPAALSGNAKAEAPGSVKAGEVRPGPFVGVPSPPAMEPSHVAAIPALQRARGGRGTPVSARVEPRDSLVAEDGGVMLVRGQSGGVDLPMPTVSLGAQPLLYVSAGKRAASSAGASF